MVGGNRATGIAATDPPAGREYLSMRLALVKVYRAFPELDHLSDTECESVVRNARTRHTGWLVRFPAAMGALAAIGWPIAWIVGVLFFRWERWAPIPQSGDMRVLALAITTILFAACVGMVMRDITLWWALRREIAGAQCPKCEQSLLGLRIEYVGLHPGEPGRAFVRCPECGRRHNLLEIGLTPRDLIPYEHRAADERVGTLRRSLPLINADKR